jgi:ketosteroid isomerase-like protein
LSPITLDGGDIDRLVGTADPEIIICNENQPTTVGVKWLRDKYSPRVKAFNFESNVYVKEIKIFGDFAVMVINFDVKTTHKKSGEKGGGSDRLILGYRRDEHGE